MLSPPADWRNVLMPPGVAALPVNHAGLPVPYISATRRDAPVEVAPCPELAPLHLVPAVELALYDEDRPPGTAGALGTMSMQRQRHVVLNRLCSVCGGPLGTAPGWMVYFEEIMPGGHAVTREPLNCAPCMAWSLQVCPRLIGAVKDEGLHVLRVRSLRVCAILVDLANYTGKGPLLGGPRAGVACAWLGLLPLDFDPIPSDDFLHGDFHG